MPDLRQRISTALRAAMLAQDRIAVSALRSALAALANAEAVRTDPDADTPNAPTHPRLAGTTAGVGATDVERRVLDDDEQRRIVQAEIDERLAAASQSDMGGRPDRGVQLRAEAEVLATHLNDDRDDTARRG
jgi:hypothetical protein